MGLAERRAIKDFQDNVLPGWHKKINDAAGIEVPLEIDWESLGIEDETHLYNECWPKVFFVPLVEAFKSVARDDMGKEALREGLKKVIVKHNPDVYSGDTGSYAIFKAGVLALEHAAHSNVDYVDDRVKGISVALEKGL
jgi:hypothetical protein